MAKTLSPHRAPFRVVVLTGEASPRAWMRTDDLGFEVERVDSGHALLDRLGRESPSAVVIELSSDPARGLPVLHSVRGGFPRVPAVVLAGNEAAGLGAIRQGAQDYLPLHQADGATLERCLRAAIERSEAEAALRFDNALAKRYWAAQFTIRRLLARASGLEAVAPHVLQVLCETIAFEVGELWVRDEAADILRLSTQWHVPEIRLADFTEQSRELTFAEHAGLPGRAWARRAPVWIPDVTQDDNFARDPSAQRTGLRGAYAFTVEDQQRVLGVLAFFSREAREPDQDLMLMMASVGAEVGGFLARKQDEQALQEAHLALADSERTHRRFVECLNERYFFYRHDRAGDFTFLSPSVARVLGYSPEDYRANYAEMFTSDPCNAQAIRFTEATLRGEPQPTYEVEVRARDGSVRRLEITEYPVPSPSGEIVSVEGIARDVTDQRHVEQALRESEHRSRTLVEHSTEAILVIDAESWRFEDANQKAVELFGYPREVLLGLRPNDLSALRQPDGRDYKDVAADVAGQAARGEMPAVEWTMRTATGREFPVELRVVRLPAAGRMLLRGAITDISARRKEQVLRDGQSRVLEMIATGAPLGETLTALTRLLEGQSEGLLASVLLLDEDGVHVRHGAAPSLPRAYVESVNGESIGPEAGSCGTAMYRREPVIVEDILQDPLWDRHRALAAPHGLRACWSTPILSRQGRVLGSLAMYYREVRKPGPVERELIDVATRIAAIAIEREEAEKALEAKETRYRRLFEAAKEGIALLDFETGWIRQANPALAELLGLPQELLVARSLWDLGLLGPALGARASLSELQQREYLCLQDLPLMTSDGRRRHLEFVSTVYYVDSERVIQCNLRDVTERKQAQEVQATTYRIAEAATTGEGLEDLLWAVHTNLGELMPAQNFFVSLYDEATQLVSFPYWVDERQLRPKPRAPALLLTDYVLRRGAVLHATPERTAELVRSGAVSPRDRPHTDWIGVPLQVHERTIGVLAVTSYAPGFRFRDRDVETLQFVSTQVAMAIDRRRGEQALRLSEATFRSLVENAPYGIYRATPDGRFASVNPALVNMLGYTSREEVMGLDMAQQVYKDLAERSRVLKRLREREFVPLEAAWKRKDGSAITVRLTGRAVRDSAGMVELYEVMAEDVSERLALEGQLRQAQKIEAVGRLAGGIAHDFNNIMNVILGYTEILQRQTDLVPSHHEKLEEIRKAGQRAASLTQQLLAFSRKQILQPRVLLLNTVVSEMESMLRRLIGEDVQLVTVLAAGLRFVKADPGQMEQVLMNLAVNARDAMPQGGTLLVETTNLELGENDSPYRLGAKPGPYVLLSVIDTGEGMDAETLSHIFEPFFTTREQGHGTGLGLATVYGIVKQSGGYIMVESAPGKGTAFRVYLPSTDEEIVLSSSDLPPGALERATETVLLVEDDAALRAVVREVLEDAGYSVLVRHTALESVELARAYAGHIDLLLTDVIMPELNGPEVAEILREIRPDTRVLYMSGYTDEALVSRVALGRDVPFIQKPFSTDNLLRTVRAVLKASR
jgi:two-component system, cell cycle sensor histidine kinase and response regulator CckA